MAIAFGLLRDNLCRYSLSNKLRAIRFMIHSL